MHVFVLDPKQILPDAPELARLAYEQIVVDANLDRIGTHSLCNQADEAGLILAPIFSGYYGPFFDKLRRTEFFRRYKQQILIYSPDDNILPVVPGIYPSCSRMWRRLRQAAPAHYRLAHWPKFHLKLSELGEKDVFGSFVGSIRNHPVRSKLLALKDEKFVIGDATGDKQHWWNRSSVEQMRYIDYFREVLRRSRFVFCPRGVSPSTQRVFEAMEAAAVPVIIADDIVLPQGPDWDSFALSVPEKAISDLPHILRSFEAVSKHMGLRARQEWENYFSPETSFNSIVNWAEQLLNERQGSYYATIGTLAAKTTSYLLVRHWRTYLRNMKANFYRRYPWHRY